MSITLLTAPMLYIMAPNELRFKNTCFSKYSQVNLLIGTKHNPTKIYKSVQPF